MTTTCLMQWREDVASLSPVKWTRPLVSSNPPAAVSKIPLPNPCAITPSPAHRIHRPAYGLVSLLRITGILSTRIG